jgi:hypothetical protein
VSASFRAHLQAWLQGNQSPATGNCAGSKKNDGILRGYITVDTVNTCNLFFPSDCPFYQTILTHQNVLWGDYFYVHPARGSAIGETLVHLESCPTCFDEDPESAHAFYTRYCTNPDFREPLPTTLAARFLNKGVFSDTDFLIWREADSSAAAYPCSLQGPLAWYPLEIEQIVIFDENEQPVTVEACPSGNPTCEQEITIPDEAQRVNVRTDLAAPFDFGWIYLNLQHPDTAYGDPFAQAWVTVNMSASGSFSVGFDAIQLDNANDPVTTRIP